jgi:polysaccharide chain length determinant protein (PEP-CTERM system associated)
MVDVILQLKSMLRSFWLHRWLGLGVAWLVAILGAATVYIIPDQYEANAKVYVDTQSILKPLMRDLAVQPNVDQQITMMSRTLLSRPNIEKVIRMSDMDVRARTPAERDRMIDELLKNVEMRVAGGTNLYSIIYKHRNQEESKRVVQSLLTLFVEQNLGDKRKDSDQARRFIDEQIKVYEQKLVSAENALKEFKLRNMETMPGQRTDYFSRMGDLNTTLNQAKLELRESEMSRDALKRQLATEAPTISVAEVELPNRDNNNSARDGQAGLPQGPVGADPLLEQRLVTNRKTLDDMRLRFTDEHPDVKGVKRIIEQLEEQRKEQIEANTASLARARAAAQRAAEQKASIATAAGAPPPSTKPNPVFEQMRVSMAESEAQIAALRARVSEFESRLGKFQGLAAAVPKVEAEFSQLNRDYDINRDNYQKLLARREAAQMSGEMDASSGVAEFRVIEPPRVNPRAVWPNRPQLLGVAFLAALGLGGLATVIRSQLSPVFTDRRALRTALNVPMLGTVSLIRTGAYRNAQRKSMLVFALGVAALFGTFIVALTYFSIKSGLLDKSII